MPNRMKRLVIPLATGALASASAQADTRSTQALPVPKAVVPAAHSGAPQGPKGGFPENRGLARAREVANGHARFLRPDSEG